MLGFSPLSAVPFSDTSTSEQAIVYLTGVQSSTVSASITPDAKANKTVAAVTSTTSAGTLDKDAVANVTLSSATSSTTASAFADVDAQASTAITGVASSVAISTVDTVAKAREYISVVTASGTANSFADVDAQASTSVTGVTASTATNTVTLIAKASVVPASADATFTAADFADVDAKANITVVANNLMSLSFGTAADSYDADANVTLASVEAASYVNAIEGIPVTANPVIDSVSASILNNVFTDVDAKATIAVTANNLMQLGFGTAADAYDADANVTLSGVEATTAFNEPYFSQTATIDISSAAATGNAFDVEVDAQSTASLTSPGITGTVNLSEVKAKGFTSPLVSVSVGIILNGVTTKATATTELVTIRVTPSVAAVQATGVVFDYTPYADSYDRDRVLYLIPDNQNYTAYITSESRTVYIQPETQKNVVYVTAEDRTVRIEPQPKNTSVYIAA